MDNQDIALLMGHIAYLQNQVCMAKAMHQVSLELLAIQSNSDMKKVLQRVNQYHAAYLLDYTSVSDQIMKKAMNPDAPAPSIEDFLKEFGDSNQSDS